MFFFRETPISGILCNEHFVIIVTSLENAGVGGPKTSLAKKAIEVLLCMLPY